MQLKNNILILLRIFLFLLVTAAFFGASVSEAAKVTRTKGRGVEIELAPDDDFVKGDKVNLMSKGKKIGIAQVTKIKNKKVIAKLLKGKAVAGATVSLAGGKGGSSAKDIEPDLSPSTGSDGSDNMVIGFVLGYDLDSQKVSASNDAGTITENLTMSGSGFSAKAYADIALADELGVIARFGVETFAVTGTAANAVVCGGTTACKTDIMYLSGDLLVRYVLSPGTWNPYLSGGLGIYFPLSKTTNILDENKIASTTIFFVGGGIHMKLSGGMYIPFSVEYGLFPPSNQVTTNFISAKLGLGWAW